MEGILSTVIMKTDLAGFTDRVSTSSHGDLSELLKKHDSIIRGVIDKNGGKIIKGEGDSFWITFKKRYKCSSFCHRNTKGFAVRTGGAG